MSDSGNPIGRFMEIPAIGGMLADRNPHDLQLRRLPIQINPGMNPVCLSWIGIQVPQQKSEPTKSTWDVNTSPRSNRFNYTKQNIVGFHHPMFRRCSRFSNPPTFSKSDLAHHGHTLTAVDFRASSKTPAGVEDAKFSSRKRAWLQLPIGEQWQAEWPPLGKKLWSLLLNKRYYQTLLMCLCVQKDPFLWVLQRRLMPLSCRARWRHRDSAVDWKHILYTLVLGGLQTVSSFPVRVNH